MPEQEATHLDERVSNVVVIESEVQEPEPGDGQAAAPDDTVEAVEGYAMPQPPAAPELGFAPEAAAADAQAPPDPLLQMQFPDIGAASFGGFAPETVHGADDRRQITATDTYPWRVHASLLITAADGSNWIGTGWFISPRVLITAGHCVYIKGSGVPNRDGWVTRMRVIPGRNGTVKPHGEVVATKFHSVRGWTEHRNEEYDYGAIVLDEPLVKPTGWIGFGRYDDDDLKTVVGNIAGYPGDKPPGTQWYGARRIDSVTPRKVRYDIDTAGGQSGAAVYRIKDGKRYAVAVHAYGGDTVNSGTRINGPVYDNIAQWKSDHE
jgi:V8-like Glu-specific endopeptidase